MSDAAKGRGWDARGRSARVAALREARAEALWVANYTTDPGVYVDALDHARQLEAMIESLEERG